MDMCRINKQAMIITGCRELECQKSMCADSEDVKDGKYKDIHISNA